MNQATVSRWERGTIHPERAHATQVLRALQPEKPNDAALRRLVETSSLVVHLVTDVDHLLLAASRGREAEWRRSASSLRGQSLWPAASPQIQATEDSLEAGGWWSCADPS